MGGCYVGRWLEDDPVMHHPPDVPFISTDLHLGTTKADRTLITNSKKPRGRLSPKRAELRVS